jgi:hypothetical protein
MPQFETMKHSNKILRLLPKTILLLCLTTCFLISKADLNIPAKRAAIKNHIAEHYPTQLTYPQKKNRRSMSQFGYNLYLFRLPLYPIIEFINPKDFGTHSYSKPARKEHNGVIYTCAGGFIDFSHLRAAADWSVYLTFKILSEGTDFTLAPESGSLTLHFKNLDELSVEDIANMAQKIAFERLLWHEACSWYYHFPNHKRIEQQSAFTPEDTYSNFLGTLIGKNIALRILHNFESISYEQIATEEIDKAIASLNPVSTVEASKQAYDIVDRYKQLKLLEAERNKDIWWDSQMIFMDPRYMFKRDMSTGPRIEPWLVPQAHRVGCSTDMKGRVLNVPEKTEAGASLYNYYEFLIQPDSSLFFSKRTKRQLHTPFTEFSTQNISRVIKQVGKEMEKKLLPGFDKRNSQDPISSFGKVRRVIGKY